MNFKSKEKQKGLTMIELLATIAILVSAVMVLLVLGDRAVSQAGLYSAQTRATFLAKEGMEIVSAKIDEIGVGVWRVSHNGGVSGDDCEENLTIDTNGRFYVYGGTTSSPFSRCVYVEEVGGKKQVVVEVTFSYRGENKTSLYRIFH